MKSDYTVQTRIRRPVEHVFQAIVEPRHITRYFIDETSGPLVAGRRVIWTWKRWGDHPVIVEEVVLNEKIVLSINCVDWSKNIRDDYEVTVFLEVEALGENETLLKISETGWRRNEDGLRASHQNCEGWTHMQMCLKAYLEHGIDLR